MDNRNSVLFFQGGKSKNCGCTENDVIQILGKLTSPTHTVLAMSILCGGVSFAQSDPQSSQLPTYEQPSPLPDHAVSSKDFEQYVGMTSEGSKPSTFASPFPSAPTAAAPIGAVAPSVDRQQSSSQNVGSPNEMVPAAQSIPWWQRRGLEMLLVADGSKVQQVDLEQLIWQSMQYSPRIQSILLVPKIQRTDINAALGQLDPRRFAQTNYHDTSDPVGNTLTTGGPTRLNEQFWENSVGIRDQNLRGGKTELSQMFDARDNNSLFFIPKNQADTKLSLNYTQPLMRGSGRYYNTSSIRLAGIKTRESIATANQELQKHAMDITDSYWDLVLQRYLLAQASAGKTRLESVRKQLENRRGRDLIKTQIGRADSAIATQQGQIANIRANIKSRQENLRRLVNAPELAQAYCDEIIPLTTPVVELPGVTLESELTDALQYRGDILAIQQMIQSAIVQKNLATNELRPKLDFLTDSYVRGLRGDNAFAQSFGNQFDTGRPSFATGLVFETPAGNRTAKANVQSRELEKQKLLLDYQEKLNQAREDIVSAINSSEATYESVIAAVIGTFASLDEVDGQTSKFNDPFGDNPSISQVLNDLVDAENRLILSEASWARAQTQHMQALARIKFEAGTLLTISAE